MKMAKIKKRIFLLLIFMFIFISIGNVYLFFIKHSVLNNPQKKEESAVISDKKNKDKPEVCYGENPYVCYKQLFEKKFKTSADSQKDMYKILNQKMLDKEISTFECHEISHHIGTYTFLNSKDPNSVFNVKMQDLTTFQNCITGYYHGVLIGMSNKFKEEELIQELKKIAARAELNLQLSKSNAEVNLNYEILHGLGHATFEKIKELDKAILLCKKITSQASLKLCAEGVFMSFFFSFRKVSDEYELDVNYCLNSSKEHQSPCFSGIRNSSKYLEDHKDDYLNVCNESYKVSLDVFTNCLKVYVLQTTTYNKPTLKEVGNVCSTYSSKLNKRCLDIYLNTAAVKKEFTKNEMCSLSDNIVDFLLCKFYRENPISNNLLK